MRTLPFLALLLAAPLALAQPAPRRALNHVGRLLDAANNTVTDNVKFTFKLYAQAQGGTALWTEKREVQVNDGYYALLLGDPEAAGATPLDVSVLAGTVWLGVTIDGTPEFTPRHRISHVPFALRADVADSMDGGTITNATITNSIVDAAEIKVNGVKVVDAQGRFVGPTTGLLAPDATQLGGKPASDYLTRDDARTEYAAAEHDFTNRAVNSSFERGAAGARPDFWTAFGTGTGKREIAEGDAVFGGRALRITDAENQATTGVSQVIVPAAQIGAWRGQSFTASVFAKRVAGVTKGRLCLQDGPGADPARVACVALPTAADRFERVSVTLKLAEDASDLNLVLDSGEGVGDANDYLLDGVSVVPGRVAAAWSAQVTEQIYDQGLAAAKVVQGAGSTLDADLLDGLDSAQLLRSDTNGKLTGALEVTTSLTAKALGINGKSTFSRDGVGECCGNDATIAIGEATSTSTKRASISFHNGGISEATFELAGTTPRRFRMFDNQNLQMGLELTGDLGARGAALTGNATVGGNVAITGDATARGLTLSQDLKARGAQLTADLATSATVTSTVSRNEGRTVIGSPKNGNIWGTNSAGNFHLDSDKSKSDGRLYLNWFDGKGITIGNGAEGIAATIEPSGAATFNGALTAAGLTSTGTLTNTGTLKNTGKAAFSRDGAGECCGNDATVAISESTSTTDRRASISFHNGGRHEGTLELSAAEGNRRFRLFDNQNLNMGLEMTGPLVRRIARTHGNGWDDGTDVGRLNNRTLTFTKVRSDTAIRIAYVDNLRVYSATGGNKTCRWEVRYSSADPGQTKASTNACGPRLIYDLYQFGITGLNNHHPASLFGTCYAANGTPLPAGTYTFTVWVTNEPHSEAGSDCSSGWAGSYVAIEAEEVF